MRTAEKIRDKLKEFRNDQVNNVFSALETFSFFMDDEREKKDWFVKQFVFAMLITATFLLIVHQFIIAR